MPLGAPSAFPLRRWSPRVRPRCFALVQDSGSVLPCLRESPQQPLLAVACSGLTAGPRSPQRLGGFAKPPTKALHGSRLRLGFQGRPTRVGGEERCCLGKDQRSSPTPPAGPTLPFWPPGEQALFCYLHLRPWHSETKNRRELLLRARIICQIFRTYRKVLYNRPRRHPPTNKAHEGSLLLTSCCTLFHLSHRTTSRRNSLLRKTPR